VVTLEIRKGGHPWGDVLFDDGQAAVCFEPKTRGEVWAKIPKL
jgi:hypothetical protein